MDDSTLITLVQKYNELYNVQNQNYMNQQRRENIWDEIGDQFSQTGAACKERWQRIRENFRRAINIRKTKSGQAAGKLKPPKFFKELSFLIPYLNDDENRHSNIPRPDSYSHRSSSQSSINSPEDDDSLLSDFSSPARTPTPKRRQYTSTCTSHPSDQSVTAASVLKEYLDSTKAQATSNSAPQPYSDSDNIIDFFLTMAKTVKDFPLAKQLKIKAELFQMVHNVELEIMNESMFRLTNETNAGQPIQVSQQHSSHAVGDLLLPNSNIPTGSYQAIPSTSHSSDVLLRAPDKTQIVIQSNQILKPSSHTINFSRPVGNLQQPNYNISTGSYQAIPSTSHSSDVLITSAQQYAADESQVITSHDTNEDNDDTPLQYKLSDYVLFSKNI